MDRNFSAVALDFPWRHPNGAAAARRRDTAPGAAHRRRRRSRTSPGRRRCRDIGGDGQGGGREWRPAARRGPWFHSASFAPRRLADSATQRACLGANEDGSRPEVVELVRLRELFPRWREGSRALAPRFAPSLRITADFGPSPLVHSVLDPLQRGTPARPMDDGSGT